MTASIEHLQRLLQTMQTTDAFTAAEIKDVEKLLAARLAEDERRAKAADFKAKVVSPDLQRVSHAIQAREDVLNGSGIDDPEVLRIFAGQHHALMRDRRSLEHTLGHASLGCL